MLAQKVKRLHSHQLQRLKRPCPEDTQAEPMKATGYMNYNEAIAGWDVQYWCAKHQKLHLLKDKESDAITSWLAQTRNLDNWVKITAGESFFYSQEYSGLKTRCPICEKTIAIATGIFYYDKTIKWIAEYWCPYDEELFTKWDSNKDTIIKEITKSGEIEE